MVSCVCVCACVVCSRQDEQCTQTLFWALEGVSLLLLLFRNTSFLPNGECTHTLGHGNGPL